MNVQKTKETKWKQIDIELMRIIACFFVIFNHTETNGYFLFSLYDKHSLQFWIYLFLSVFCKFSVPLFFTISGALMLDREPEPLNRLWRYRILKMVIILVTWSLFTFLLRYIQVRFSWISGNSSNSCIALAGIILSGTYMHTFPC